MSCGNRFSCGIKRFQQPSFAPNRPTNPELHQENESRLSELLRQREEQDKRFSYASESSETVSTSIQPSVLPLQNDSSSTYSPWVQRSSN
jgi:hypothetical protein